jgi:hypothetical protein
VVTASGAKAASEAAAAGEPKAASEAATAGEAAKSVEPKAAGEAGAADAAQDASAAGGEAPPPAEAPLADNAPAAGDAAPADTASPADTAPATDTAPAEQASPAKPRPAQKKVPPPRKMGPRLPTPAGAAAARLDAAARQAVASKLAPERGRKALLVASIAALTATIALAIGPAISSARSLRTAAFGRALLRNGTTKQITGYVLVALCVLSLGLSLRKRWERFQVADVAFWRAVHGVVAACSLLAFLLHTGLLLGSKLNFLLAVDFFAAVVLGSLSGITSFLAPRWSPLIARDRRLWSARIHLFAMWPLPLLLALHILAAYYY